VTHAVVIGLPVFSLLFAGCGMSSRGTHTVSTDHDSFTEEINGRRSEFQDRTISVADRQIPIEKRKSVIRIDTTGSGMMSISVNGKQVHEE